MQANGAAHVKPRQWTLPLTLYFRPNGREEDSAGRHVNKAEVSRRFAF